MMRVPVDSRNLLSVGYEPDTCTVEIEFRKGGVYQYFGVPEHVFNGLLGAGSKGQFFAQYIRKGGYPYSRVA